MSFLVFQPFSEEERAGCFTLFVFLLSYDCECSVSLPCGPMGRFVIVAFPGHTHFLFGHNHHLLPRTMCANSVGSKKTALSGLQIRVCMTFSPNS